MRLLFLSVLTLVLFIPCLLCIITGGFIRFFGLVALAVWVYLGYMVLIEYLSYRSNRNNEEEST